MNTRRWILGVALALIVVALGVALYIYQQLQGDPIPLGTSSDTLGYMSNEAGDWDVMLINAEGEVLNLTADGSGAADYFASWAFNATRVNFLTNRGGEMGAGQVNPDGSDLKTLSVAEAVMATVLDQLFDWDPMWSVDGRLAWVSLRPLNLEIFAGDGDAQNGVRLTDDGGRDWFMSWSPDGTQFAFSSDRTGDEEIYLMDADGTNLRRLTDEPLDDTRPAWSMDGETILFLSERRSLLADGDIDIYLMDADGGNQRPIGDETFIGNPMHSPDGSQIAYISNEEGDWNIYVMDADGENVRRITESEGDELFPVWRPTPLIDDAAGDDS